jgi:hypothetical protein
MKHLPWFIYAGFLVSAFMAGMYVERVQHHSTHVCNLTCGEKE